MTSSPWQKASPYQVQSVVKISVSQCPGLTSAWAWDKSSPFSLEFLSDSLNSAAVMSFVLFTTIFPSWQTLARLLSLRTEDRGGHWRLISHLNVLTMAPLQTLLPRYLQSPLSCTSANLNNWWELRYLYPAQRGISSLLPEARPGQSKNQNLKRNLRYYKIKLIFSLAVIGCQRFVIERASLVSYITSTAVLHIIVVLVSAVSADSTDWTMTDPLSRNIFTLYTQPAPDTTAAGRILEMAI